MAASEVHLSEIHGTAMRDYGASGVCGDENLRPGCQRMQDVAGLDGADVTVRLEIVMYGRREVLGIERNRGMRVVEHVQTLGPRLVVVRIVDAHRERDRLRCIRGRVPEGAGANHPDPPGAESGDLADAIEFGECCGGGEE